MVNAIRVHTPGGPEVLTWDTVEVGTPGPGEVRLKHSAVGLNYIDTYHRTGLYPQPLPFVPGLEAAGVVTAVGPGVSELKEGDRVGYCSGPIGAYSEERIYPVDRLVKLPDWLDDRTAAAVLLQGMTAQYLLRRTFPVRRGDTILIQAAAGGVGLIVCQWASALGATVIGTVSTEEKAELARAHGCHHPILYTREDFVARTRDLTGGRGVDVAYDSVGADTFMKSLDCVRRLGTIVSFGQASGKIPPFDTGLLAAKGGLFLTRPSLFHYVATREELLATAEDLFAVVKDGRVKVEVRQTFALKDAEAAHRALEGRQTVGSTVLLP